MSLTPIHASLHTTLHTIVEGRSLTEAQAQDAMRALLAGESTPVLTAAFLTALRMKGETVEELAGFARAMRAAALQVPIEDQFRPVLDTCGTGGNGTSTFNISTVAAFVAAGAGVRVAKHGNRSISSRCGSADVLEALGVRTAVEPDVVARAIREAGIGFLFAPLFHGATRNVQPVRIELKMRTAFNFLGPLTNPARAEIQVAGTWSDEAAEKIAGAMARLGSHRAYAVHGSDGMGELTITGPSTVFAVQHGAVSRLELAPEDFGLKRQSGDGIRGGDAEENRAIAESILSGERGAPRDIVLMNAALALVAAGKAPDFREGIMRAEESIDSGAARGKLDQLRAITTA
ncbi:MAG TPA: anthranilate phosphoribosyltransferase [Bryobacteraceae bacterium]|jgi:anthranilate phosphoribosyltransferase|nr:anthranilate phosphoribosyltransferase [Bryobacteraceae bacterium]